ncbi:pickpocket protein 28-like isoform X2 [Adelges cooleyi]|uniref:pickpocket protein 28-like isoform X2 n=1 Tax=Adelges cooleyi TaxID=133065 RepID=UPI00217F6CE8|nr:pickpocket protein 28-like isoform X2 [Adelges cooleyi]
MFQDRTGVLNRIFWVIIISLVVFTCGLQIHHLLAYWMKGRMAIKLHYDGYNVSDFPFPAITFCSDLQLQHLDKRKIGDDLFNKHFEDTVQLLCSPYETNYSGSIRFINSKVWQHVLSNHGVMCDQHINRVLWLRDKIELPCKYFQPMITSYGLCYSLNMIPFHLLFNNDYFHMLSFLDHPLAQIIRKKNLNTWNPEVGFKPDLTPFDTPWRVTGDSVNNRVSLHFKFKRNPGVNCPITGKGFVLIMHNPADAPISLQPTAYISGNRRVAVSSIISIWPTAPTIHAWSPKSRNCYFQHEKPLRYFKVYTENNCDIECRINNTIKRCGCSAYYHPRDYDIPICGSASYACMINTPGYSIFNEKFPDSIEDECDCMPACTEVRYEFKVVGMFKNWTNSDENE